jgi:hypothetical protein
VRAKKDYCRNITHRHGLPPHLTPIFLLSYSDFSSACYMSSFSSADCVIPTTAAFRTIDSPQHLLRVPNTNISRPNSVLLGQKDPTPRRSTLPLATNGVANALGRSSPAESGVVLVAIYCVWSTRRKLRAIYRFESCCNDIDKARLVGLLRSVLLFLRRSTSTATSSIAHPY